MSEDKSDPQDRYRLRDAIESVLELPLDVQQNFLFHILGLILTYKMVQSECSEDALPELFTEYRSTLEASRAATSEQIDQAIAGYTMQAKIYRNGKAMTEAARTRDIAEKGNLN